MKKALPREVPFIIAAVSAAFASNQPGDGHPLINCVSEGDYSMNLQSNKLAGKELINVGIYSAIYLPLCSSLPCLLTARVSQSLLMERSIKKGEIHMKTKDIITSAVFSVLSMAGMLAAAVTNVSGHTAILYPPVAAFFMGLLLYILLTKVPKKGAIMIFCIVPALYFLTTGLIEGIIGIASILLFAFIAECVVSKDRTSASRISAACIIYTLSYSTTGMAECFLLTDHYCTSALEHGINAKVVADMRQMYEIKPLWLAVITATALFTFLGTLVAGGITKRHLKKAGMA